MMIDKDGTPFKENLGANAILGVSIAVAKAAADSARLPLYEYLGGVDAATIPVPMMNVLNGGRHADNNVDFQEFMIVPLGAASFREACAGRRETFHALKKVLSQEGLQHGRGRRRGLRAEPEVEYGGGRSDPGGDRTGRATRLASRWPWRSTRRRASSTRMVSTCSSKSDGSARHLEDMVRLYEDWVEKYPIVSLEDGVAENDAAGWRLITDGWDAASSLSAMTTS